MATAVEISEVIRNYAIVAAGSGGVGIAVWRAIAADRQSQAQKDQAAQARREHATGLFAKAISELDHADLHMRLSAILMLRNTVDAYPELSNAAIKVLTSYLMSSEYSDDDPPADVREIIDLVVPTELSEGEMG